MFSKYAWVVPLKDKRRISIVNVFQKIVSKGRKPNKIWFDQGGEFYNNLLKLFFKIKEMYSTYRQGKSVAAESFIKTLKNNIFKHMTAVSKNIYFDVLDDIFDKYNNTVHKTIKKKPTDVTSHSYAEHNEDSNEKDLKFKVGSCLGISKYKSIFAKGYTENWSEEVFIISKIENTGPSTYVISDLNGEKIARSFYEKGLQKTSQEKFRKEKVIKEGGDKLYVKWKGYNDSFNKWVNKKDLE